MSGTTATVKARAAVLTVLPGTRSPFNPGGPDDLSPVQAIFELTDLLDSATAIIGDKLEDVSIEADDYINGALMLLMHARHLVRQLELVDPDGSPDAGTP